MTSAGGLIEVQGTAEGGSFSRRELDAILDAGWVALEQLFAMQRQALEQAGVVWDPAHS
jgi:ribonuclease PH